MSGVFAGFLGIVYNRTLLGTLAAADRLNRWPVELRAAVIGAAVGMLAWFTPGLVGSGESLIQRTLRAGGVTLATPLSLFILRLGLGSVSYAAGTPGGLMAPILALGALFGLVAGILMSAGVTRLNYSTRGVRRGWYGCRVDCGYANSSLHPIVLVIEMTASFAMFLPMLIACFSGNACAYPAAPSSYL